MQGREKVKVNNSLDGIHRLGSHRRGLTVRRGEKGVGGLAVRRLGLVTGYGADEERMKMVERERRGGSLANCSYAPRFCLRDGPGRVVSR